VAAIAARLGLETTPELEALEAESDRRMVSLDAVAAEEDAGTPRIETIGGEDAALELAEDRIVAAAAMRLLDQPALALLRMRFVEELSQREIAARFGRSQMYVSRRMRAVLERLREETEEPTAEPDPAGTAGR
jgi:RNA polymerase sigma-B factor